MKQTIRCLLCLLVSALMFGVSAFAQVTTSGLNGRVSDESGAPVVGAAVVATHTESGTKYAAVSNEQGRFVINGMRAGGPYSVEVSCLGFQTVTYTDIKLQLAESFSLNASLKEDKLMLGEAIVIATPASKFSSEKTGAATNISRSQIDELPNINRNLTEVAKLSPYGGNGMSFSGSDGRSTNFTVDGANFNNNFGLTDALPGGNPISVDAIEEIQVVIAPFDVRQTNFIGGGLNAITKSGTNTFKGSAFVYHNNEFMRGNTNYKREEFGDRDKERVTTYGFTLGGPIVKNKLFFFVNFEREVSPSEVNLWRASADGKANPDQYVSRVKIEDMEKVKNHLLENYGYDPGSYTNFPATETNTKVLARIDWNITDAHHLAVRYNYTLDRGWVATNKQSSDAARRATQPRFSQYGMAFSNSLYSQDQSVHTVSVDLNSRFSNDLSNQFLFTYTKEFSGRGSTSDKFPFIDILDGDDYAAGKQMPYISAGYELFTWNNGVNNDVVNLKDDITYFVGNHKITAGINYEYQMADNSYMRNGTGYYRYASLDDFLNQAAPETVCINYGYDGEEKPAARVRFHQLGIYAQDEWSPVENFKLTYGLRLDGLFFDNKDIMTNNAIKALDYNGYSIDTGKWPTSNILVSPRIGFSWDVLNDKSLKVRGGTGIFTGRIPLVFFTNMPTNSGMVQNKVIITTDAKGQADLLLANFAGKMITDTKEMVNKLNSLNPVKYPLTMSPEQGVVSEQIQAVDPDFKMPSVWKTSIAIDYQFPVSFPFSITGEFIYNKKINDVMLTNVNVKDVEGFPRFTGIDNRHIYPSSSEAKYTDVDAFVLTNTNKGYGYIANVMLKMQPLKCLSLTASYTHTVNKEISGMPGSDASSAFTYIPSIEGPNNLTLHNSTYATPDRFFANLTYHDKGDNHYTVFYETWRGGYNYSYMYAQDLNNDGYAYDLIYIPANKEDILWASPKDADNFFAFMNQDKYLSSHKGQYAEAYSVYSPWTHKVNFRYAHDFKFKIGKSVNVLQLNLDFNNVLNLFHPSLGVSKIMNTELNSGRVLSVDHINENGQPVFKSNVSAATPTWLPYSSIGQCWSCQFGIKYIFN